MKKLNTLLLALIIAAVFAYGQSPIKLVDGTGSERQIGAAGKTYNSTITTLPSSDTALTTTTTAVQLIFCANIDSVDRTITITDNQGTPKTYFNGVTIGANTSMLMYASAVGLPFNSGIRWSASAASAVNCQIVGVQ